MKLIRIIGVSALLSLSVPAWSMGADIDGNRLLSACGAAVAFIDGQSLQALNAVDVGFCLGVMSGVMNMNRYNEVQPKTSALFCPPDNITNAQAARIILKSLRDYPEELHKGGTFLTVIALGTAFPCAKK